MTIKLAIRIAAVILLLSFTAPLSRNQEYDRRDGNWWRQLDAVSKANYLAGFVDGMQLGNRFSYWGIDKTDKDAKDVSAQVTNSFSSYRAKYLSNVTNIQLTDRLDTFYSDSKNRDILVYGAVWLVLNQIAGKPNAEMQALVDNWRKNADKE